MYDTRVAVFDRIVEKKTKDEIPYKFAINIVG